MYLYKYMVHGTDLTRERNIQGTDISNKRNVQGMGISYERNVKWANITRKWKEQGMEGWTLDVRGMYRAGEGNYM